MVKITAEHLAAVKRAGACAEAFDQYKPGMELSEVATEHLIWVEDNCPELVKSLRLKHPIWTYSGSGYGSGSGYAHNDGYGAGDAYGSGDAFGYGYGSGSGYGCCDFHGHGYGERQRE